MFVTRIWLFVTCLINPIGICRVPHSPSRPPHFLNVLVRAKLIHWGISNRIVLPSCLSTPAVMEAWYLGNEDALRRGNSNRQVDTLHGGISHHLASDPPCFNLDYSALDITSAGPCNQGVVCWFLCLWIQWERVLNSGSMSSYGPSGSALWEKVY